MRILGAFLVFVMSCSALAASKVMEVDETSLKASNQQSNKEFKTYYGDRERGWFWYEDPAEIKKTKKA